MSENILTKTIDVEHDGETYTFKIPTFMDEIRLGQIERNIRREADPETGGSIAGLDGETIFMVRAAAAFVYLLQSASATWVYSPDPKTKLPVVDTKSWPPEKVNVAMQVYDTFITKVQSFRSGGAADGQPDRA